MIHKMHAYNNLYDLNTTFIFELSFYPSFPRLFLRVHNHQTDAIKRIFLLLMMEKCGSDADTTLDHDVY